MTLELNSSPAYQDWGHKDWDPLTEQAEIKKNNTAHKTNNFFFFQNDGEFFGEISVEIETNRNF